MTSPSKQTKFSRVLTRAPLPLCSHAHSQLEEARAKIARLETELAHLPAVYASRARLELERAASENDQLVVQARTLARRLSEAEEDKRRLSSSFSPSPAAPEADSVLQPLSTTSVVHHRSPPAGPIGEQHDSANGTHGPELKTKHAVRKPGAGERDADQDSADQRAFDSDVLNEGQQRLDQPGALGVEGSDQVDFLRRENQALKIDKSSLEERVSGFCARSFRRRTRVDGTSPAIATMGIGVTCASSR